MKILHISDLHIGKIILEQSMLKDQEYILNEIIKIAINKDVDAIMITGDVYDRSIPPADAVSLFDNFLTKLKEKQITVLLITGNHDSKDRLGFGKKIMRESNVFIANNYEGEILKVPISKDNEAVNFYLLPFLRPADVVPFFENVTSYNDAIKKVLSTIEVDKKMKNIILTHQFITGDNLETCDSEQKSLGGIDNVDVSLFDDFDYVAMGHIHGPQRLMRDTCRYAGSPLKYSFSEENHNKSIVLIDTNQELTFELIPLKPLRDMHSIYGTLNDLLENKSDDYVRIVLTDEEEIYDPISKLRSNYPNMLRLEFDNIRRLNQNNNFMPTRAIKDYDPISLFNEFYLNQNNISLNEEQIKIVKDIFAEVVRDETN